MIFCRPATAHKFNLQFFLSYTVFIGTVGVQMVADSKGADAISSPEVLRSPFTAILDVIMSKGGFQQVAGVIALTSSMAAIMSTADSNIIAISHLVTVECVWPFQKDKSAQKIAWIGRLSSLASVILATAMGLTWQSGVSALTAINFPCILQAAPAFFIGLYGTECGNFHPWSITAGAWAGFIFVFLFFFLYLNNNVYAAAVNCGIIGVMINVLVIVVVEMVLRRKKEKRPAWDIPSAERFGETQLTANMLDSMMRDYPEPLRNGWFIVGFFVATTLTIPMTAEHQPPLTDNTSIASFPFASPPPVVRGIPWWFFKQILTTIVPYGITLWILWKAPNVYPSDDDRRIDTEGIDPEIIELTAEEMNKRETYDTPIDSARRRRMLISAKMEELGLSRTKDEGEGLRLSCILKEKDIENNDEEEKKDGESDV